MEQDVSAVNIQENNQRCPINYITPPGVRREQLFNNIPLSTRTSNHCRYGFLVKIGTWRFKSSFQKCKY
jgi:hypothetical protein